MAMHLRAVPNPPAGTEPTPAPVGKHDAFVAAQLRRAERRIRTLDVSAALLGFLVLTCATVGGVAVADYLIPAFAFVRPFVLVSYLFLAAVYLGLTLARPLLRRVNPYYTAVRMEGTTPGAKNSVVNWLDLHEAKLPAAIRNSLGQRAAKDLARADVEKAFSGRRTGWLGVTAGAGMGLLIALLFWIGPGDFFFHLRRSFAPSPATATRTTLTVVQPAGGDATVTAGKPVKIAIAVGGKVPDPGSTTALMLHYRYDQTDPYTTHWLQADATGEWARSFSPLEVRDGFYYKISGGDAETPEYQIKVQSSPLVKEVEATYHYRDYTGRLDEKLARVKPPKIEVLRGTEVTLLVRTNRTLKDAHIELETKDGAERIPATLAPKDARTFWVQFVVDRSASYRVHFTSTDGETNVDDAPRPLVALPDNPPNPVELTSPGKDVELPVNGLLPLEGLTHDDIGVKNLTLKMQVVKGVTLEDRKYRSDAELKLAGGGYPRELSYKDTIDLTKVKTEGGGAVQLQPGMELEYWLEARDACDYPQPDVNVSQSKHYLVKLLPPETDQKKQQDERDRAKEEQKQHDQKQNADLKKEADKREAEKKKQEEEQKNADQQANGDNKKPDENGDKGNQGEKANPDQAKKDDDLRKQAGEIQKKADAKHGDKNEEKSQPKDDPKQTGEAKGEGQKDQPKPGEGKPEPKQGDKKEAGDAKGAGEPKPGEQPSQDKPEGAGNPMEQKGTPKNDDAKQPNDTKGEAKEQGPQQQRPAPSESKEGGSPDQKQGASANKPEAGDPKQSGAKGEPKQGGPNDPKADQQPAAASKAKPDGAEKSQGKSDAGAGSDNAPKAEKKDGTGAGSADKPAGEEKPDVKKPENTDVARGNGKGDPQKGGAGGGGDSKENQRDATSEDVKKFEKGLEKADAKEREKAADELKKIENQAKDPKAREEAAKALQKWSDQQRADAQPAEGKGPPQDPQKNDVAGNKEKGPGEPTPGEPKQDKTKGEVAKGDSKERGKPEKSTDTAKGGEPQPGEAKEPGTGMPGSGDRKTDTVRNSNQPEPPPLNEKADPGKAGALQLEDIRKKLDKEMLDELKWTEEDKERFLKDLADAMKRQEGKGEKVAAPQNTGTLPSIGAKRVTSGTVTDVNSRDKPLPPPEYRSPYANFLKDLGQAEKDKK